ncbi:BTB/POZ domain-containing protein [Hirschfeldia incana]|nr:BTB/POZ domain-containing protein [Hirschfeldia incana]
MSLPVRRGNKFDMIGPNTVRRGTEFDMFGPNAVRRGTEFDMFSPNAVVHRGSEFDMFGPNVVVRRGTEFDMFGPNFVRRGNEFDMFGPNTVRRGTEFDMFGPNAVHRGTEFDMFGPNAVVHRGNEFDMFSPNAVRRGTEFDMFGPNAVVHRGNEFDMFGRNVVRGGNEFDMFSPNVVRRGTEFDMFGPNAVRRGTEFDMFDPNEHPMFDSDDDTTPPHHDSSSSERDFGFAFNNSNFSDRLLRIEIMGGGGPSSGCGSIADWTRHRKRRREDSNIKKGSVTILDVLGAGAEEQVLTDMDDGEAMIEEASTGDEDDNVTSAPAWGRESFDYFRVKRVRELHISSPILAAKSPFFYKLFSNGMMETVQREVTLVINASEEAALMELLNFMYTNAVSVTTVPALMDLLMAADKFEVISCMRYCSRLLQNVPMTTESALLYLDLPSTVVMAASVQPLTDAAKLFLAARFKDITKFQQEFMSMPLAAIEAVLSSDDLQVASEDVVYDLILKWARAQYPSLEERREILGSRLARSIRFPFMTCRKLKKVLTCVDFEHEIASKLVLEALFFKAEAPHRQRSLLAVEESASVTRHLMERSYRYRPVKVVEFEIPLKQCVVYLDLKREECIGLFPSGRVYSQAFHLGGQGFFLATHCNMDPQGSYYCFGLFLGMQEKGLVSFGVDYEFSVRSKPSAEFISKYKGSNTFTGGKAVGYRNLFGIPWTYFVAEDSDFFINGILHLKAELTINGSPDDPQ